ncbi:SycD/LcrH family type III secretion system chaperone [Horticoccus sp. 23ND18S-11]|uniref:SycD/LcrH family type III secretion system chaperone n=1 Tax=Horticoccus sp. 23ND18S-11 TaxID=3391832 RepID=UPI0039C9D9BC
MTTTEAPNPVYDRLPFHTEEEWKDVIENFGKNGRTFRDFTQLTPESMEAIYLIAYNLYNGAKYAEAEKVFRLLAMLDHFKRKFWKGLGACQEAQKKYEDALKAYGYLGVTDIHDPYPPFQAAKCFVALGKAPGAEAALRAAVFNSNGKPEHAALHSQASGMLELVQKARAAATTTTDASRK